MASTSVVRSAMRSAKSPSTRLRKSGDSSQARKTSGGIRMSLVGRVATPLAISGSARNRQALDTRHSSPGPTRYNSSARPSAEARDTRISPSSTSGNPLHGWRSPNSTVPAGTVIGNAGAPRSARRGVTLASAGYSAAGSGMGGGGRDRGGSRCVVQPRQVVQDRTVGPLVALATMDQVLQGSLHRLHGL